MGYVQPLCPEGNRRALCSAISWELIAAASLPKRAGGASRQRGRNRNGASKGRGSRGSSDHQGLWPLAPGSLHSPQSLAANQLSRRSTTQPCHHEGHDSPQRSLDAEPKVLLTLNNGNLKALMCEKALVLTKGWNYVKRQRMKAKTNSTSSDSGMTEED